MSNIITIAYTTEGSTDQRLLENIIKKTFEETAFQCEGLIEVYDPTYIKFKRKNGFVDGVINASMEAFNCGTNALCIHVDSDDATDAEVIQSKITPALAAVGQLDIDSCKNLVAVIPVYMSEAWMLADKVLLKEEIGTTKSDQDLGLLKAPESIPDPKEVIKNALRIAQSDLPKRRNRLTISDLYQPVGQKIAISELEKLPSYLKFKRGVEDAFRRLSYLQ